MYLCVHLKGHFPRCPAASASPVISSSLWATRGNKEAGLSFLTPSPVQWRHTHTHTVLSSAEKKLLHEFMQRLCVCKYVCPCFMNFNLLFLLWGRVKNTNKETHWSPQELGLQSDLVQQEVETKSDAQVVLWVQKHIRKQKFKVLMCSVTIQILNQKQGKGHHCNACTQSGWNIISGGLWSKIQSNWHKECFGTKDSLH